MKVLFSIADAAFDLYGVLVQMRLGILVLVVEEAGNRTIRVPRHCFEPAAADAMSTDPSETALDRIDPRGPGRGKVQAGKRWAATRCLTAGYF
ncbi:MAG: hypothetical protein JO166_07675 [Deltaproteobacteria bacterium]|nr:hypothetical protein [Deltaproteobacteria bacterium]